jgi:site-specific recombinase XerC
MLDAVLNQINNTEFFVWDAVVAWRDYIYQADFYNNTKSNYLSGMLKLIETEIVNVCIKINAIDEQWVKDSKQKIDDKPEWSAATKIIRKSCLNSFYKFIKNDFDQSVKPYRRHPKPVEIKHVLSNVPDKALTINISPSILCNALSKINERDAYIIWLMMWTGQTLDAVLDLRKENLRTYVDKENPGCSYIDFAENGENVPHHIVEAINVVCKDSVVYLFETSRGKRVTRIQVMRNLKQAGYNIGLDFDLTPKVLHGYVCAYMVEDKRSELEKGLGISID